MENWQFSRRVYEADDLAGYFQVLGVKPGRSDVRVLFKEDLADWGPDQFGVAQVIEHIEIDADRIPDYRVSIAA